MTQSELSKLIRRIAKEELKKEIQNIMVETFVKKIVAEVISLNLNLPGGNRNKKLYEQRNISNASTNINLNKPTPTKEEIRKRLEDSGVVEKNSFSHEILTETINEIPKGADSQQIDEVDMMMAKLSSAGLDVGKMGKINEIANKK